MILKNLSRFTIKVKEKLLPHNLLIKKRCNLVLSLTFLQDVGSVNAFSYVPALVLGAKSPGTLYFQLIDSSVSTPITSGSIISSQAGRRFMPAVGATLSVTLNNLDDAKKVIRTATQPFSQDASIWSIPILGTDFPTGATVDVKITLNESGLLTYGSLRSGIRVVGE